MNNFFNTFCFGALFSMFALAILLYGVTKKKAFLYHCGGSVLVVLLQYTLSLITSNFLLHSMLQSAGIILLIAVLVAIVARVVAEERKEVEDQDNAMYKALVTHAPFCIHSIDMQGKLTSMNPAGLTMIGKSADKINGIPYLSFVGKNHEKRIGELLEKAYDGQMSFFDFDVPVGNKRCFFRSNFVPIKAADGSVEQLMGISQDVTLLKEAEEDKIKKIQELNVLEQQKKDQLLAQRQAELQSSKFKLASLRSQMNPHFLFNALNAVQSFIVSSRTTDATEYLADFSNLIRRVLEYSHESSISLRNEIELLKLYVRLEQMRFSHKFDFIIDVDPSLNLNACKIPPMLIQPFIENAIIHGLAPQKEKGGLLELHIATENGKLLVKVKDNGIGREEAMKIKERKSKYHKSMATEIQQDRFELYEQAYRQKIDFQSIDLYTQEGQPAGTEVQVCFALS